MKLLRAGASASAFALFMAAGTAVFAQTNVITYHYDTLRTGWNQDETTLTVAAVGGGGFGLQHVTTLDDQVDAQPLVVTNQTITGVSGARTVVYVATEHNTVYAIDGNTGGVLRTRSLGAPVSQTHLPGQCGNNGPNVGINSTPVIDIVAGILYVVAYTWESGAPVYRIHALDLASLADKVPTVPLKAYHAMPNGGTYRFIAVNQRQRPALLEAGGTIYAGFGSFCDFNENDSRGWVIGWKAGSLVQTANNELTNRRYNQTADCPWNNNRPPCMLASVWMSGYGLAGDAAGNVYFVTGNSAPGTYDGVYAIQDSVVKMPADLHAVADLFTPSDAPPPNDVGVNAMDGNDNDLGSGGVMLLPDQPGTYPHLAVAAGKIGPLYVLNRDHLGGHGANGNNSIVGTAPSSGCWCGPSYFVGSDGVSRVVTSSGSAVVTFKVRTVPSTALVQDKSMSVSSGQDPGFMTSVSSNGTAAGTAIVWAVPHPMSTTVQLYAFNAMTGAQLFSGQAGTWPNTNGNANIVPVVANGKVYVAANASLAIFGVGGPKAQFPSMHHAVRPVSYHAVTGVVTEIRAGTIVVRTRTGRAVTVDRTAAMAAHHSIVTGVGAPVTVIGTYANGVLRAQAVQRAKRATASWEPDR